MDNPPLHLRAHGFCRNNEELVRRSEVCGCFYCCRTFAGADVSSFVSGGRTGDRVALCPHCIVDSVVPSASGIEVTSDLLKKMKRYWFRAAKALTTAPYGDQLATWPQSGRVILAQFDEESVIVYQAFGEPIAQFAVKHRYFGGGFKLSRMSWIKPNFLWMMYRSGWGTKPDQEVVLAIRLRRSAFDAILSLAVPSSFDPVGYTDRDVWQQAVTNSDVRLQWDPDHDPQGGRVDRRAIQLGLRGGVIERYAREWILEIHDISDFVSAQRVLAVSGRDDELVTPVETVYPVTDAAVATRLGLTR